MMSTVWPLLRGHLDRSAECRAVFVQIAATWAPQPPPRGGFDAMSATPRSKQIAEDLEGRTSAATPRTQAARVERARKGSDEKRPINPGMGSLEEGSIGADDRTESGMHVDYPTPRVSEASDATRTYSGMHTDYRTPRESEATEISESSSASRNGQFEETQDVGGKNLARSAYADREE